MKNAFIIIAILLIALSSFAQPQKAFFVIHCDPNETENFPELVKLVDSANYYNIKLTIEFTLFWVDSILPFSQRLNKISIWQAQGHEIALHHHAYTAPNIWDYYSNAPLIEIHNQVEPVRDTLDFIAGVDSLYNYVQQISSIPIYTSGVKDITEMPSQSMYKTSGVTTDEAFSNSVSYSYNGNFFCETTHAFLYVNQAEQYIEDNYVSSVDYNIIGANCHVYNFADLPKPVIDYFKFINDNGIESLTVKEILDAECECGSVGLQNTKTEIDIYPNPTNDILKIKYHSSTIEKLKIKVFNINGQLIYSSDSDLNHFRINTSDYLPGIYTVQVSNKSNEIFNKQIIKQ